VVRCARQRGGGALSLDADDWLRLDRALDAALAQPEARRIALLREALGERPALLQAALAALDPAAPEPALGSLAPGLLAAWDATQAAGEDARWRGRRIGAWRVLDRIGAGGMGTVYRVERADGAFERIAALKLLPWSLQSEELQRRFAQERRIAARLQHPAIARLLDGGSADDGSPYLVLEFVDGAPIDVWCEQRRLGLQQRLHLLCAVCDAVQFAHRNLVVHRDLKPANILVDADGQVKLLDFGIARLLEDVAEAPATGPLGARLTPDYAAPEQFTGEAVSAATDVYALGCLAYRLLVGRVPLLLSGQSLAAMLEQLHGDARPGLRVLAAGGAVPAGIRRGELDADLEAIAARAVAREPNQRYGAVAELAADLRHWLDGLPVLARGAGRGYRVRRFICRHRLGLALTATVMLALGGSAALALQQAEQARAQRDEAQAMVGLLRELMQLADPNAGLGHQIGAHALLRTALARVEADRAAQPDNRIALLDTLADALLAFELNDEAIRARELAHALQRERLGPEHPDTLASKRRLGLALRTRIGDQARSEALFLELYQTRQRLYGERHPLSAESAWDLGFFYLRYTDLADPSRAQAEPLLESAWQILRDTLGADHPRTGQVLFDLGLASGRREQRIARMREGIAIRRRALGTEDAQLLQHQGDLALVLGEAGEGEQAIALARRAAEAYQMLRGELHPLSITLWNNLAGLYRDFGHYEQALDAYRWVDERVRRVVPNGHLRRAFPQFGIGFTLNRLLRHREAETPLRAALAVVETHDRQFLAATTRRELGDSLRAQGREQEARQQFEHALRQLKNALGREEHDPDVRTLRERLAGTPRYQDAGEARQPASAPERRATPSTAPSKPQQG
jgi:serine/threonine-protein kinase